MLHSVKVILQSSVELGKDSCGERIKGRWRCLLKINDININTVSDVVLACCVLHNFCEFHREQYLDNWDCPQECVERAVVDNRDDSASAVSIRDALLTIVCRN